MAAKKSEVLQGTLDLMVLKTLHGLGPLHGFGIARRIEQLSENVLQMNEGTVYTSLLRLQQRGGITARWGVSRRSSDPTPPDPSTLSCRAVCPIARNRRTEAAVRGRREGSRRD